MLTFVFSYLFLDNTIFKLTQEKEAHKNGETQSLEDTSEQSNPPPVDAGQLNKFGDENTNQNDVQVMLDYYIQYGKKYLCQQSFCITVSFFSFV